MTIQLIQLCNDSHGADWIWSTHAVLMICALNLSIHVHEPGIGHLCYHQQAMRPVYWCTVSHSGRLRFACHWHRTRSVFRTHHILIMCALHVSTW